MTFLTANAKQLLIIDEVQRTPDLFSALRGVIDDHRRAGHRNSRFLLLGSASRELLCQSSESLAGRIAYLDLNPLLADEAVKHSIDEIWLRGGFPESLLASNGKLSLTWRRNFITQCVIYNRKQTRNDINVGSWVSSSFLRFHRITHQSAGGRKSCSDFIARRGRLWRVTKRCFGIFLLSLAALDAAEPRLQYVTTAHQLGPVNYRDPLGVMSPSGDWLAYAIAQHLYLQPIAGGPVRELPAAGGIIRHIAWMSDSRRVVIDDPEKGPRWWVYDIERGTKAALWEAHPPGRVKRESLEQLVWSRDGKQVAGVVRKAAGGSELWKMGADGSGAVAIESASILSFPAWRPDGSVGCLAREASRQTLSIPCGLMGTQPAYGALEFSPDGRTVYFGVPNAGGTLDLWSWPVAGGTATRLTQFMRDTYAPSAARDGTVLFKLQDYRTFVAMAPAEGGESLPVTAFQSETPSFSPDGKSIGITYGAWRRIVDDFQYPDIAQDAGIVSLTGLLPKKEPTRVVQASKSEDQGLCWSPNGKWIAFHSHKDQSDDVWLQQADGSQPAKLITHFGRGAETGWPRWSADGKTVLVDSRKKETNPVRGTVFTIEVDQNTGVAQPEKEIGLDGFAEDVTHTEWGPDGKTILFQAVHFPGGQGLYQVPRGGGKVTKIFGFSSEQRVPGFGVSPDGKWIAYVAPATDGFLQLFQVGMNGTSTKQLTFDRSNKTQPAYSPDGKQIAFTVWSYDAQFWLLRQ